MSKKKKTKKQRWEIVSPSHAAFHHTSKREKRIGSIALDRSNIIERKRFVVGLSASLRGAGRGRPRNQQPEIFGEARVSKKTRLKAKGRGGGGDDDDEWRASEDPSRRSKRKTNKTQFFKNDEDDQSNKLAVRLERGRSHLKTVDPKEKLVLVRRMLELSVLPEQIPCRSDQAERIHSTILQSIKDDKSGSLYISGQPGTGKTVTVHHVIQQLLAMRREGTIPPFTYIEANALQLPDAASIFSFLYATLKGENLSSAKAARALTKQFFSGTSRSPQYILVFVDELDSLMAPRSMKVMHTLFEWASRENARLFVLGIANTMNLADHLSLKTASRFGVAKEVFPPYSSEDIMLIVKTRLGSYAELFQDHALKLVAIKTSNVTGDIRRALQVCRSCVDALEEGAQVVTIKIMADMIKMICESPLALSIKACAYYPKLFLIAMSKDMAANGTSETTFGEVLFRLSAALAQMEVEDPGIGAWERICGDLESQGIVLANNPWKGRKDRRLQVAGNPEDIEFHLNDDPVFESYP